MPSPAKHILLFFSYLLGLFFFTNRNNIRYGSEGGEIPPGEFLGNHVDTKHPSLLEKNTSCLLGVTDTAEANNAGKQRNDEILSNVKIGIFDSNKAEKRTKIHLT